MHLGCTKKYLSLAVPRRCGAITCGSSLRLKELDSVIRSRGGGLAPSSLCLCGVHVSERAGCNRQAFGRVGIGERSFMVAPAVLTPRGLVVFRGVRFEPIGWLCSNSTYQCGHRR